MNREIFLQCEAVSKSFQEGKHRLEVLSGINLTIYAGEQMAIMGRSGSGKSTLLQILGGLDKPTSGQVLYRGKSIASMRESLIEKLRTQTLGFVYQVHHLLPEFTALENVMLPLLIARQSRRDAELKSKAILAEVGLSKRLLHRPAELSGGEKQRVAIARALVHQPRCILADEPTGNLDDENALKVFELMQSLSKQMHAALVLVTHDQSLAKLTDRTYILHNGQCEPIPVSG